MTYKHFCLHAQLTAMFLNYSLLRRLGAPDWRQNGRRFLALLEAAHDRLQSAHGLPSQSQSAAEKKFRESLIK